MIYLPSSALTNGYFLAKEVMASLPNDTKEQWEGGAPKWDTAGPRAGVALAPLVFPNGTTTPTLSGEMETVYEISPRSDATSPRSEVVVAGLLSEETSPRSVVIVTGPESTSTSPATLDNTAEANESSLSLVLFEVDAREADVEHTQEAESDEPRHTSWDLKSGTVVTCEFNETGYHNPEEQHELLWDTTKHLMKTGFQRTLQTKNFVLYSRDEDGIESNVAQRLDRFHEVLEDSELVDQSPAARKFLASPVYAYLVNTNARLHKIEDPFAESKLSQRRQRHASGSTSTGKSPANSGFGKIRQVVNVAGTLGSSVAGSLGSVLSPHFAREETPEEDLGELLSDCILPAFVTGVPVVGQKHDAPIVILARSIYEVELGLCVLCLAGGSPNALSCSSLFFATGWRLHVLNHLSPEPLSDFEGSSLEEVLQGQCSTALYDRYATLFTSLLLARKHGAANYLLVAQDECRDVTSQTSPKLDILKTLEKATLGFLKLTLKDMAPLIESEEQKVQHKLAESRTFVPHFVAEKGLKLSDTRSWMMPVRFLTKIETPLKLEEASKKDEDEEGELGLFRLATFGRSAKDSQRVHPVGDSSTHNSSPTEIPVDRPQFGEVSNKEAIEETESNKAASEPEEEDANMATTWEVIAFTFLWLWEFESSNALVCFGAVSYQAAFAATQILLVNLLVSEEVVGNGEDVSPDFMLMSCYVLALLVSSMANIRSQYVLANALPSGGGFIPAVQHMYVVHVCNLSQTYLDTIPKAEIQSVIENSVTQMNLNIDALFFLMLAIGQLTSVLAVLFVIFPPMALLVLCLLPIFALISRGKSGQVGTESLKLTESKRDFSNCMYEMIGATVPNKLMGKPQIMMERLQDGASLVEDGYDRVDLRVSENVRNMNFSSLLLLLSNIILGVVMMGVGDIDAAAFISFVMGVQSMMDIIKTTAGLFAYFQVSRGSLSDMMRLARASIDDPPPGKVVDPLSQYAIEMSNMDFSYGAARGEVSNKPQMAIPLARFPAGKKVGVVGKSGSGKSTLMKLINGVYKPTNGKLYYFGVEDTSVYTPNLISVIEQEVLLFDGTIKQNLLWSVGEK
ncbi:hypothetical protein CYMTET_20388, partial [Cymbomonas tetramitiformis]